ncbi:phosphoinositide-3-kinase-interacting protein 1 [Megalops cyprinoides]|uniref:phosphoinositide-3-kinase-interacting protein 1 n=1 Tax=Megalops cyprinoides TaxID=118141 RepID=UPI0018648CB3|nr:phosphoinositide-3-kinase-interacting protein 1 [Megalops cyprinoides]
MFLLHFALLCVAFVTCASNIQECTRYNGVDYRGEQQITSTGKRCLNWMNITRDYNVTAYTDAERGVGDHSYCRNPDSSDKPWCYVADEEGRVQRQDCAIATCRDQTPAEADSDAFPVSPSGESQIFEPAPSIPEQGEGAAVQSVIGISQRVRTGPKKKKDLGTLGYVLGILMMAIIIILGVGITLGYFYKRGRDLKKQHEQRVYEREMQRITLPLSAFSNPTCELVDENTIVISPQQTPGEDAVEGGDPLMGQAGTPGA